MLQQRTDSHVLNSYNANVWTGTQFESAPFNCLVELAVLGSATGLQFTFASGIDFIAIDQAVSIVRAANQYALYPDDFVITDWVGYNQRILEAIRNTTGGTLSSFSSLRITPI